MQVPDLINNNVQVMGHIGLLPQSEKEKFKFKGKKEIERNKILKDAKLLDIEILYTIINGKIVYKN